MDDTDFPAEFDRVLFTEKQIAARVKELAAQVDEDYVGEDLLLVGVLKGAMMIMADLSRELKTPAEIDWMAVSSVRLRGYLEWGRPDPQGPRHQHRGPKRPHRRGCPGFWAHAAMAGSQPAGSATKDAEVADVAS